MPMTVLIVDDAEASVVTLEIALDSLPGIEIVTVANASQAFRVLKERNVAAVITDIHMPHMDGFEFLARLRAAPGRRVPVLVVSGDSNPDTPAEAARLGADGFFAKPYSPAKIRAAVARLLEQTV